MQGSDCEINISSENMSLGSDHLEEVKLDHFEVDKIAQKCLSIQKDFKIKKKMRIDEASNGLQAFEMFKQCHE